jgi:hypothetical protein
VDFCLQAHYSPTLYGSRDTQLWLCQKDVGFWRLADLISKRMRSSGMWHLVISYINSVRMFRRSLLPPSSVVTSQLRDPRSSQWCNQLTSSVQSESHFWTWCVAVPFSSLFNAECDRCQARRLPDRRSQRSVPLVLDLTFIIGNRVKVLKRSPAQVVACGNNFNRLVHHLWGVVYVRVGRNGVAR